MQDTLETTQAGEKAATRMTVQVETTGSNLTPEVAALIDELTGLHTAGNLKAAFQTRDALDSPIWSFELTAPQLTLRPLFSTRNVMVNSMTVRRSGANCVLTAVITIMS